ncbi:MULTISPECIES: hypothetical protein [Tetragenococcus]|uniref:Uncharacterized protein n=2 Tax=Tetragenococcus TaxID=51668 RepID=A0A091BYR3_9ENTE|nr:MULTISPECIES: hypothetical protein [Tetragenococcus]GMA47942.1 hypothetical protein GCM10025854_21920 [Tetragenococcus muriaticus]GMA53610.1 hypothetical protein GCM10025857_49670 [Alicyclobacillus contaminans]AYW47906.1 hypothetical protein C7K38_05755 [Tetragenococcus osmophilus]KFN89625.1 hypothetical protein TMU3MR103_1911 [Tetragenococcus muriaticus 3MR10-3]GMA72452.1 hypothetical protein GCM10025885_15010 [Tetragenococcus osmophilus]
MDYLRDIATSVVIYSFFAFVWFGWALEGPKRSWKKYLVIACTTSFLLGVLGIYLIFNYQDEASVLTANGLSTWYYIIVIIEFFIGGIGAHLLYNKKLDSYISPWICLIVGIHFSPLAFIFQEPTMHLLALLFVATSIVTIKRMKVISYRASAITGLGAGSILLCFALFNIIRLFIA